MTPTDREKILKKAYEIWEAEGRPHGRDMEHWLKAELEITTVVKPARKAPAKKVTAKKAPAKKPAAKKPAAKKPAAKAKAPAKSKA